jgi:hypothetical protein
MLFYVSSRGFVYCLCYAHPVGYITNDILLSYGLVYFKLKDFLFSFVPEISDQAVKCISLVIGSDG